MGKKKNRGGHKPEIRYYSDFSDDFVETRDQVYQLKQGYKWIHHNPIYGFFSLLVYIVALIWAFFYVKVVLRAKIERREAARRPDELIGGHRSGSQANLSKSGIIYYSNHTMYLADVLAPFIYSFPRRPYIICSASNLGIPVIGKLLPLAGAMPIPDNIKDLAKFNRAVNTRLEQGKTLVVYPEAHLWPFCTFIRPLEKPAFHYPAVIPTRVFASTTTFQEPRKPGGRPRVKYLIEGPFVADSGLKKDRQKEISDWVQQSMETSAKKNTFVKIEYKKKV